METVSEGWLGESLLIAFGLVAFGALILAMLVGAALHARHDQRDARTSGSAQKSRSSQEGYIVTAILSLLGIMLGFTFSLAVDRYDTRRSLVLAEANAIYRAYLQAQLLEEPYRSRVSDVLVAFTDNRVALGEAAPSETQRALLATSDRLLAELWTATAAAFPTISRLDFSSEFVASVNDVIAFDAARKAARLTHVPAAVFALLYFFLVVTAAVLGYVQSGARGRSAAGFQLALLTLFLLLVLDIDRPTRGAVRESQGAMERLRATLSTPPVAGMPP